MMTDLPQGETHHCPLCEVAARDLHAAKLRIAKLESMQRQIIHGSNVFMEIANVIREAKEIIEEADTDNVFERAVKWLGE